MKKIWKLLLTIGGIIGGMLLIFSNKNAAYDKNTKKNNEKIKEVKKNIDKVKNTKEKIKNNIKKTSEKISLTKSKVKPTTSSKSIISDFKKKYRK